MAIEHHPIMNGSTKKIIFLCVAIIGLITLSMIALDFTLSLMHIKDGWIAEIVAGHVELGCIGYLGYAIKSFFDTRQTREKHQDKLSKMEQKRLRLKDKYHYKIEIAKAKHIKKEHH